MNDSVLLKLLEAKRLFAPIQKNFSLTEWESAFHNITNPTPSDQELFNNVRWFSRQLEAIRSFAATTRPALPKSELTMAVLNLVLRDIDAAFAKSAAAPQAATITIDTIDQAVPLRENINQCTASGLSETLVDAMRFELAANSDVKNEMPRVNVDRSELTELLTARINAAVAYDMLEHAWMRCFREGWTVDESDSDSFRIRLKDKSQASARSAILLRQQALLMEYGLHAQKAVDTLVAARRRCVVDAEPSKSDCALTTALARDDNPDIAAIGLARVAAAEPYLLPMYEELLPNFGGVTIHELLLAWEVLATAGFCIARRLAKDRNNGANKNRFTLKISRGSICKALRECLGIDLARTHKLLDVFVWDGTPRSSLWIYPFVAVGSNHVVPVLPALTQPNLLRSVEHWMEDGGLSMDKRGRFFEEHIRHEFSTTIRANELLRDHAGVLDSQLQPRDKTIGDVDVVLWIHDHFFFFECKCVTWPTTPGEWLSYDQAVDKATVQLRRKAAYFEADRDELLKSTMNDGRRAVHSITSCVVVSGPLGAFEVREAIAVVDVLIPSMFLRAGVTKTMVVMSGSKEISSRSIQLYESSIDAASAFPGFLRDPPHIRAYRANVACKWISMPDYGQERSAVMIEEYAAKINDER